MICGDKTTNKTVVNRFSVAVKVKERLEIVKIVFPFPINRANWKKSKVAFSGVIPHNIKANPTTSATTKIHIWEQHAPK